MPEKSSNKPDNVGAERMEERGMPKENKKQQNMLWTQRLESVLSKLRLIHQRAKSDTTEQANWCYNLREEPYAVIPHVRICAGGRRETGVPTATPRLDKTSLKEDPTQKVALVV